MELTDNYVKSKVCPNSILIELNLFFQNIRMSDSEATSDSSNDKNSKNGGTMART